MEFLGNMKAPTHDHDHQAVPPDLSLRVKALESLLVEKGLVDPAALDELIDTYENKVGARVVARAWVDPAYKQRLLTEATAAIAEFGYGGRGGEHMVVVENTPKLHNLIVCTGISLGRNGRPRWPMNSGPPRAAVSPTTARVTITIGWPLSSAWLQPRGLANSADLAARKEAWAEAYRRTPHGKPVELNADSNDGV